MPVTLVQLTDTHIHDQPDIDFKGTQPGEYLRRIIQHSKHTIDHIDAVIVTGDLTHDGGADACQQLATMLQQYDCPVYVTPGNHDEHNIIQQHLLNQQISMPDKISLSHWQLLFADSHIQFKTAGRIETDTLQKLAQQLNENSQPSLLFTHHPPLAINSQWMDEIGMQNGDTFMQQMRSHKNLHAIIFGHIHQLWDSYDAHLRLLGTPSTCVQFKPLSEDFGVDDIDPGYRIITLQDDQFETRVVRCSMQLKKIISGGQTGVDRAALDSAIELAIPHGGWCPRGRLALDGTLDDRYQLQETPSADYAQRTEWNVRDADATLILNNGDLSGGTLLTAKLANNMQKPLFIVDLSQPPIDAALRSWLKDNRIKTLNIAGPRHTKQPEVYQLARNFIVNTLCTGS